MVVAVAVVVAGTVGQDEQQQAPAGAPPGLPAALAWLHPWGDVGLPGFGPIHTGHLQGSGQNLEVQPPQKGPRLKRVQGRLRDSTCVRIHAQGL